MPDYANDYTQLETVAREHARWVGSPGFIATPGERTYKIYPEGMAGPEEEYWPTETGGRPDLRSITTLGGFAEPEENIYDLPDKDFKVGRIAITNEYLEDMKPVDALWTDRTQPPPPQYVTLSETIKATHDARMGKLNMENDRAELTRKRITQDPNYDPQEQRRLFANYYSDNPVWKEPSILREKATFTPLHIQTTLGELATDTVNIQNRQTAVEFAAKRLGPNFATEYPEAMDIILKREKANYAPLQVRGMPEEPQAPSILQRLGLAASTAPATQPGYQPGGQPTVHPIIGPTGAPITAPVGASSIDNFAFAPREELAPYWHHLSPKQQRDITNALYANPTAITTILKRLSSAGR